MSVVSNEPRVLVVGYSRHLQGGVSHVTQVLMQNFKNMELHPSLYCYKPKSKAGLLYIYSFFSFLYKIFFRIQNKPEFIIIIIGSSGDALRSVPFIWFSCLSKTKVFAQYHKSIDIIFYGIKSSYIKKIITNSLLKVKKHCFLSKRLKDEFQKLLPCQIDSVVIPNALEQKWLDISPLPYNERSRDVVFLGRWSVEKGVDDLIQGMAMIPSSITCEVYSNHLPKEKLRNIKVFPWAGEDEVMEVIRSAKLLVLPSYAEAFPTVLLEAAACGTPFLGSGLPGIVDIAEESGGGVVFEKGDIKLLQNRIEEILSDYELWMELSNNGKAWVVNLSEERVKKQWLDILNLNCL